MGLQSNCAVEVALVVVAAAADEAAASMKTVRMAVASSGPPVGTPRDAGS